MKTKIILLFTVLLPFVGTAQSKKEIKKFKIKSTTVMLADAVSASEIRNSFSKFDTDGNVIEDIEYNRDGSIKKREVFKYNKNGDVMEEMVISNGKFKKKIAYKYNAKNEKVEEIHYDDKDNVIEKHVNTFDALGNKTLETITDAKGTLLRRIVTTYNPKGLKTEKKIFDGNGQLLATRKFTYAY